MREVLLSWIAADELEILGFWVLVAGLAGELAVLFIPEGRSRLIKVLTTICIVGIIAGVWMEHVGADANKQPRRLNAGQRQLITDQLKSLSGTPFMVQFALGAAEPLDLAYDIGDALKLAGWNWLPCPGGMTANNRPAVCFSILKHIEVHTSGGSLRDAGKAALDALKAARLGEVRPSYAPDGAPVIVIIVGTKA